MTKVIKIRDPRQVEERKKSPEHRLDHPAYTFLRGPKDLFSGATKLLTGVADRKSAPARLHITRAPFQSI